MSTVTAAQVVAKARQLYDSGEIHRLPPYGYDAPVSIQDLPPYDDGRFTGAGYDGADGIQHCGVSVCRLLYLCGLVPGVDFPDPTAMQYAPALINHADADGPRPGYIGVINWPPKDVVEDHVTLCVSVANLAKGTVTTWECNTTDDGTAHYYERPLDWFDGWIAVDLADYADTPAYTPDTDEGRVIRWLLDNTGWTTAGVAGVAGNIQQESGFTPAATEAGRPFDQLDRYRAGATAAGYGLCQWSFDDETIDGEFVPGRLWGAAGLLAWCAARGLDHTTIDAQLQFALSEIGDYWPGLGDRLTAATDPWTAAQDFGAVFEGFAIAGLRNTYAQDLHRRILAGDFGPTTPGTAPRTPADPTTTAHRAVPAYI